jgi:hypothetical protein
MKQNGLVCGLLMVLAAVFFQGCPGKNNPTTPSAPVTVGLTATATLTPTNTVCADGSGHTCTPIFSATPTNTDTNTPTNTLTPITSTATSTPTKTATSTATALPTLNVTGPVTLTSGEYTYGNIVVSSGGILYINGAVTIEFGNSFTVAAGGSVNGVGLGYGPGLGIGGGGAGTGTGGGHGGSGGDADSTALAGNQNDDSAGPTLMGSGGGSGTCDSNAGGSGGALLSVVWGNSGTGSVTINGLIDMDGASVTTTCDGADKGSGGGAGGGVYIAAPYFSGSGTISANGGSGENGSGGGGGGGGIIYRNAPPFSGSMSVNGGAGGINNYTSGDNGAPGQMGYINGTRATPVNTPTTTSTVTLTPTNTLTATPTITFTPTVTSTPACTATYFGQFCSTCSDYLFPNEQVITSPCTLLDNAIVTDIRVVPETGGNFVGLIWSNAVCSTNGAGYPYAPLGIGSIDVPTLSSAWVTIGLNNPVTLTPGTYWLGAWTDTGSLNGQAEGANLSFGDPYTLGSGSWPTTWCSLSGLNGYDDNLVISADYTCNN